MRDGTAKTAALAAADRRHVWHPFTQMQAWMEEEVVVIESGRGCWLVDTDGNRYLDGVSSLWCNLHGHRVEAIDRAVRDQLGRIAHSTMLGLSNVPAVELAEKLAGLLPRPLTRVFYSDAGATAVEAALKMAYQYHLQVGRTGRTRFAALSSAYHGDTVGSVSVGGIEAMHGMFDPLRFDVVRIPSPYCYRCPLGLERAACRERCIDEAERAIERNAGSLAALVVEPLVQGAAGMITQPPTWLSRVARACRDHDVLLICDEVATGFGRVGTLLASTQEDVTPDLLCLAKGLTGGYLPVAATVATEEIFEAFLGAPASGRAFLHGHTYTGNPLGCAAALASLELLEPLLPGLPGRADRFGELLGDALEGLGHVGEVRRRGFMTGIELVADASRRERYPPERRTGHRVAVEARRRGVIIRPLADVVVLMPPLALDDSEMELLVDVTAAAIRAVTGEDRT
jgi:adenosylmethionine-8-amino-7-oxononanoate aminotransferase